MEKINSEIAAQVWQRVQQRPQESTGLQPSQLQGMIRQTWQDAAVFRRLAAKRDASAQKLKQLAQKNRDQLAILKGIYTLITGQMPYVLAPKLPNGSSSFLLRRSYGEKLRNAAIYDSLSGDREYGAVFAQLAQQEREQSKILLEILGMA